MNRFLLGALAMAAVFVLTSFATSWSAARATDIPTSPIPQSPAQESPPPQGRPNVTVSYFHESASGTNEAFVWEWKGQEIVAATKYGWTPKGFLTKTRATVAEEKK